MSQTSGTPSLRLYGPDTKHGAIPLRGYKNYVWKIVWIEGRSERTQSTKAGLHEKVKAEGALETFLTKRRESRDDAPAGGYRSHQVTVGAVIEKYAKEDVVGKPAAATIGYSIDAMWPFWKDKLLSEVGKQTCIDYVKWRTGQETMHSRERRAGWARRKLFAEQIDAISVPAWSKAGGDHEALLKRRAMLKAWRRKKRLVELMKEPGRTEALAALGARPVDPAPPRKKAPAVGPAPTIELITERTARTELEYLRAAIGYCREVLFIDQVPPVVLPVKSPARDVWLTRTQYAKLLLAARRKTKGKPEARRHLIIYLKFGVYQGPRKTALLQLPLIQPFDGGAWLNPNTYRVDFGPSVGRKKRARGVPVQPRLWVYVRGAMRRGQKYLIEVDGKPIKDVRGSFKSAVEAADLGMRVTPHTLRHTGVSYLKQAKVASEVVGALVGMSKQTVDDTYGHHDPDHVAEAVNALSAGRRRK